MATPRGAVRCVLIWFTSTGPTRAVNAKCCPMSSVVMKRMLWLALLLLSGCAWAMSPTKAKLPYDSWRLGFLAPPYMEVWTEAAEVQDMDGRLFTHLESGTVAISYEGDTAGWPIHPGWGKGRYVTGANLPKRIAVRWQSLTEPQTYRAILVIPESARQLMLTKAPPRNPLNQPAYREGIAIGLAPGGWVKVWVSGPVGDPVEILCMRAEIELKGPDQGQYGGKYVTLPVAPKAYIAAHPIPYDSWACPNSAGTPG